MLAVAATMSKKYSEVMLLAGIDLYPIWVCVGEPAECIDNIFGLHTANISGMASHHYHLR